MTFYLREFEKEIPSHRRGPADVQELARMSATVIEYEVLRVESDPEALKTALNELGARGFVLQPRLRQRVGHPRG